MRLTLVSCLQPPRADPSATAVRSDTAQPLSHTSMSCKLSPFNPRANDSPPASVNLVLYSTTVSFDISGQQRKASPNAEPDASPILVSLNSKFSLSRLGKLLNDLPRATPVSSATWVSRMRRSRSWRGKCPSPLTNSFPPASVSLVLYSIKVRCDIIGQKSKAWPSAEPDASPILVSSNSKCSLARLDIFLSEFPRATPVSSATWVSPMRRSRS
mmetsp:Transcript_57065/g.131313  ORF Transcript_57065/g.131313 Transcript_57065/m.131313 type:complete len:214 (-) Transcript_57065:62-703(-)